LLMDYVFETYGAKRAPAARRALETVESVAEWVEVVTGEPMERVEPAWRAWVIDAFASP
jgi:hypothetical protein